MIYDKARVEAIRARAAARIALIKSLESKIVKGKHVMLEVARHHMGDIESFFLQDLNRRDRTPNEEAMWLSGAEYMLQSWEPNLKEAEEKFGKFGGHGTKSSAARGSHLQRI